MTEEVLSEQDIATLTPEQDAQLQREFAAKYDAPPAEPAETITEDGEVQPGESGETEEVTAEEVIEEPTEELPVVEKKEDPVQMRTAKALKLKEAAEQRAAAAIARQQELEAELAALRAGKSPVPAPAAEPQGRPDLAKYNGDTQKYIADATAYEVQEQLRQRQAAEAINAKIAKFVEKAPDFTEAVSDAVAEINAGLRSPWSQDIIAACNESENGIALQYHLVKHPEEVDRLLALPPTRRMLELGKLEDKIATPVKIVEPVKTSNAPAPIKKVNGGSPKAMKDLSAITDQAEWAREYEKRYPSAR